MRAVPFMLFLYFTLSCCYDCSKGKEYFSVLTAYFPDTITEDGSGMVDTQGNKLQTLQDFLDGRAPYVTVSVDPKLNIKYGTRLCIPFLNRHFGQNITFEARDMNDELSNEGYKRIDICVRSEQDSYDLAVNKMTKIIVLN